MYVFLVYKSTSDESYHDELIGVFQADQLEEAKALADKHLYVRKNLVPRSSEPAYIGNFVYIEKWDCEAQSQEQEAVYRRSKSQEVNKALSEVAAAVDKHYQPAFSALDNEKEQYKQNRLSDRLQSLGITLD